MAVWNDGIDWTIGEYIDETRLDNMVGNTTYVREAHGVKRRKDAGDISIGFIPNNPLTMAVLIDGVSYGSIPLSDDDPSEPDGLASTANMRNIDISSLTDDTFYEVEIALVGNSNSTKYIDRRFYKSPEDKFLSVFYSQMVYSPGSSLNLSNVELWTSYTNKNW